MNRILAAILVTSVAACVEEEAPVGYGEGLGTAENPVPRDGAYTVTSRINFTVDMPQIEVAIASLRAFALNPARTLLTQAQQAAVPELQQLNAELPTTLRDRLEGWINIEIDKSLIAGKTARQYANEMGAIAATSLTQFKVDSSLSITPTSVVHSLTSLNFTPVALDIVIPIGGSASDTLTQRTTATVGEGGALTLGDQKFGLAFGKHAWQAINLASTTLFAGDLRMVLVNALNCPALAQAVSARCYLTSCVGHATQLQAVCERSVDALVLELRERIPAFKLDVFRFVQGSARLVDDNHDGVADRIVDGTWDAETNLGLGLRKAPATFTATR